MYSELCYPEAGGFAKHGKQDLMCFAARSLFAEKSTHDQLDIGDWRLLSDYVFNLCYRVYPTDCPEGSKFNPQLVPQDGECLEMINQADFALRPNNRPFHPRAQDDKVPR
ncbi:hypothetical protein RJ55_08224 [Drechmeria coniospora]|nr:hypothetical protein RJ55_08224 [Drechmeria coniospora]